MIAGLAAAAGVIALVDPRLRALLWVAWILATFDLLRGRSRLFLPAFALGAGGLALTGFSIGADSLHYYSYTSSLLADHDLSLANQKERLGLPLGPLTETGLEPNVMSVGPALVWMPAVALTHLWLEIGGGPVDPLRVGEPYYAAAAATTLAAVLFALIALARVLSQEVGRTEAWLAVLASVLASPIVYYAAVQPLMSHGLTFAAAGLTVALTLRAEKDGARRRWILAGAGLGLAMLFRTQSVVLAGFVAAGLWRSRPGWKTALMTGAAALIVFSPQVMTWKLLYGSFLTIPQGEGFIDWTGRHSFDVLLSADRGLFNWHPTLLLGLLGLVVALAAQGLRSYALAGLAIFAFTTFLNGSVRDWNASAAFGARRFDVVVPLLAFGLAHLLARLRPLLSARPFLLPSIALGTAVLWNLSLIDVRRGSQGTALPLDELAGLQVSQARRAVDATLGRLGPGFRRGIYNAFVGFNTYENYRPGGDFDLATLEPRFLRKGWSEVQGWDDGALFRYLLYPEGCLIIPLGEPMDLRGFVLARSPARIREQTLTVILNGRKIAEAALPAAWTEVRFEAPRTFWRGGENEFCLRALRKRPGDEGDDLSYAAAVIRVQLP